MARTAPDRARTRDLAVAAAAEEGGDVALPPSFMLTDTEAAAVNRWATKQPRVPDALGAGMASAAHRAGMGRAHLAYACTPNAAARKPIGRDRLVGLLRLLLCDRRAAYELRRVATDDVQAAMDAAITHDVFRARVDAGTGFLVQIVPV